MYRLYDDLGVMCEGSLYACKNYILNWTKSSEGINTYKRRELKAIYDYFKDLSGEGSFYGFTIEQE